jgi:hypothetical protein
VREPPIFHGEPATSLLAIMIFPNDVKKAKALAAWKLASGPLQDFFALGYKLPMDAVLEIARGAADLARFFEEARRNEFAGTAAGTVVKCLWAMICQDRDQGLNAASWETAIRIAEDEGTKVNLRTGRSSLWQHLKDFRSVLHLWGAYDIRNRRLISDSATQAVGYSGHVDVQMLMQEAETLRQQIRIWEENRIQSSCLMSGDDVYCMSPAWTPPQPEPGWTKAGGIPRITFGAGVTVQSRGKPGRRATLSKKF